MFRRSSRICKEKKYCHKVTCGRLAQGEEFPDYFSSSSLLKLKSSNISESGKDRHTDPIHHILFHLAHRHILSTINRLQIYNEHRTMHYIFL